MWLPPSEPIGPGGPNLHYSLLGDNSKRQLTTEERLANYRISRGRRVVKNAFGILVGRFRVLLTTMEQRPEVVRDIVLTRVVLHNMLRRHQGRANRPPTPTDDIQPPQADPAVSGPMRISETHQGRPNINDLMKDHFNNLGALAGQDEGI